MQLKDILTSPCNVRHMVDALDIQSGVARRMLLEQPMMLTNKEVEDAYANLRPYVEAVSDKSLTTAVRTLQFRLQGLKDLATTLANLQAGHTLDDIELFEIKNLAMLNAEVRKQITQLRLPDTLPDLEPVVSILDPEGLRIATFYVYEAYSETLRELKKRLEATPGDAELFTQVQDEEARIRGELSRALRSYAASLQAAHHAIAETDILLAKALQVCALGLCFPTVGETTSLTEMWHPAVKEAVERRGGTYQTNSIRLSNMPTVLTGSNMGGKTVVLKTVGLCQYLAQFGFGIPAAQAEIAIKDEIYCCMADTQSVEAGLSSFAAEMRQIDAVIQASHTDKRILALIDEPARTTNPVEGTALVSALVEVLKPTGITLLMVTHYTISAHACPCLRVRGMEDGHMNYRLVDAPEGDVPHEALRIAEQLGIDPEWIEKAKQQI